MKAIKKALETCQGQLTLSCDRECQYKEEHNCVDKAMSDALAYIETLEERSEKAGAELNAIALAYIETLEERLKKTGAELSALRKAVDSQCYEVKREIKAAENYFKCFRDVPWADDKEGEPNGKRDEV